MADVAPPIHEVRKGFFDRLASHASTSGYTLKREGVRAEMPFLHVGSAYKGAGGTDPDFGVNIVVTVTAFADAEDDGSAKVSEMISDVYDAVFSAEIEIGDLTIEDILIEDDQLSPDLFDELSNKEYAQRLARFNAHVTR